MRFAPTARWDERIWRPVVVAVVAYGVFFAILSIWVRATFLWPHYVDWFYDDLAFGLSLYAVLSGIHALFLLALLADLPRAWRAAPSVRKGQVFGVLSAIAMVVLFQLAALQMKRVAETGRTMAPPATPATIEEC